MDAILDADFYETIPETPYISADLNYGTDCRANREQNDSSARPAITDSVENIEQYDVIFPGYPIWWGQALKIISTFPESYDLSGKTIVPFCTSGSRGIGSSATNLHSLASATTWMDSQRFSGTLEIAPPEEFILVSGGTFQMGSLETEAWRVKDETSHTVTVSDFYISKFEITQAEYQAVMGESPSSFIGDDLPVERISWMDAIQYCNTRSTQEGPTPADTVESQSVSWDQSANGYRLPTEAKWEYACRALSINIVDEALLPKADYVGCVSGRERNKSEVFQYQIGEAGAPLINAAPVSMSCTVENIYETEGFESFICKITATCAEESLLTEEGKIDYRTLKPVLFEMPTYEYLKTGDVIGKFRSFGKH